MIWINIPVLITSQRVASFSIGHFASFCWFLSLTVGPLRNYSFTISVVALITSRVRSMMEGSER